jgi:hypothetical protein
MSYNSSATLSSSSSNLSLRKFQQLFSICKNTNIHTGGGPTPQNAVDKGNVGSSLRRSKAENASHPSSRRLQRNPSLGPSSRKEDNETIYVGEIFVCLRNFQIF